MKTRPRVFLALAALGTALGVIIGILGGPGRFGYDALAELYHGEVDTTGTVHVAIDCDTATVATDDSCTVIGTDVTVAVTVGNSLGSNLLISAFNFEVSNDRQDVFDPFPGVDSNMNGNPDFNTPPGPVTWGCAAPPPDPDTDPNPQVSVSFLSCYEAGDPQNPIVLPDDPAHVRLALVSYDNVNPVNFATATMALSDVFVFDDTFSELMSCNPVGNIPGPCLSATVTNIPPPTMNGDQDNDGVPDYTDNCPNNANPGQENSDGNFISNNPPYVVNDHTRAMSDSQGDACDSDQDNDSIANHTEECCMTFNPPPCDSPFFQTSPLIADTDGDRFRDNVECPLGSHPYVSSSTPPVASCGATTDADADGLSARIEYCFYGTSDSSADSDGDGTKDGCEAASLNTDTVVNSIDQGLLASEIMRVPPPSKLVNFDINKDGAHNSLDQGIQAGRFGKCP